MLKLHKLKYGEDDICSIRTSSESHLHWKKHVNKNLLFLGIYAEFEADNEIDISSIGNKTIILFKQNPILKGYSIISELDDNLQSGYYKSPLGCNKVNWFANENIKLENKMAFYFKNTNKDIVMTEEDEENFK